MAREKKTKANDPQKPVSVDVSKLTQGISLVFTGAVKSLYARLVKMKHYRCAERNS